MMEDIYENIDVLFDLRDWRSIYEGEGNTEMLSQLEELEYWLRDYQTL